jgi:hypothetical protein
MNYPWDQAPEWARYAAMDADGECYWFRDKPKISHDVWVSNYPALFIETRGPGWKESLEKRPQLQLQEEPQ